MTKAGEGTGEGPKRSFRTASGRKKVALALGSPGIEQGRVTRVICPQCATAYTFFGTPPTACGSCGAPLPTANEAEIRGAAGQGRKIVRAWTKTHTATITVPAGKFVSGFMDRGGIVDVDQVAETFGMSKGQLAATTGLATATLSKADRRTGVRAQSRVTEMLEIISRIREWAGGEAQAMAWYRSQPIPALDGRTSEALVKSGRAGAVRDYLDHLALGGFA